MDESGFIRDYPLMRMTPRKKYDWPDISHLFQRDKPPVSKHDGNLDEEEDYNVDYGESWARGIVITDFSDHYGETRYLRIPAKAALSLLAWLKQEEAELRRLANEQAGQ